MVKRRSKNRIRTRNKTKASLAPKQTNKNRLLNDLHLPGSEMVSMPDENNDNWMGNAKTYWFFGEWSKLAQLDVATISNHPERDRIALLVASAQLQLGNHDKARTLLFTALDWGCPKRVVAQILIAGVHNTLGRVAALAEDEPRIAYHFEEAISVAGTSEGTLVSHARCVREMARMGLLPQAASLVDKELDAINTNEVRPSHQSTNIDVLKNEIESLQKELSLAKQGQKLFPPPVNTVQSREMKELVDLCLNDEDVHAKVDELLATKDLSYKEIFHLFCGLSDHFFSEKDNSTALHFLSCARDCLEENDIEDQLFLSRKFMKLGANDDALNLLIRNSLNSNNIDQKEKETLLSFYEQSQSAEREKKEHGHEVLLNYLKSYQLDETSQIEGRQPLMIEIGTTREKVPGQGSTRKLAEFCKLSGLHFITVDMDPHNTHQAAIMFEKLGSNFEAVNQKGEDFLREYDGKMDFVFLDAYDFDHGKHSKLRQSRYEKYLGGPIDEQKCHQMHLECAQSVLTKLSINGVVCLDDTWLEDGRWCAKGTLAVPYLLDNGFELIKARNRSVLLRRQKKSG